MSRRQHLAEVVALTAQAQLDRELVGPVDYVCPDCQFTLPFAGVASLPPPCSQCLLGLGRTVWMRPRPRVAGGEDPHSP